MDTGLFKIQSRISPFFRFSTEKVNVRCHCVMENLLWWHRLRCFCCLTMKRNQGTFRKPSCQISELQTFPHASAGDQSLSTLVRGLAPSQPESSSYFYSRDKQFDKHKYRFCASKRTKFCLHNKTWKLAARYSLLIL